MLFSMVQDTEVLLERANAAIAEATRLTAINLAWQDRIAQSIDRMFLRSRFEPSDYHTRYPQEWGDESRSVRPLPPARSSEGA